RRQRAAGHGLQVGRQRQVRGGGAVQSTALSDRAVQHPLHGEVSCGAGAAA
ncbi:unnamed protein product, partial [Heterosigma akashiwo]